jgi:hypothetical protein
MRDFTDDERVELVAAAKRQIDFDDQQREAAGVDVGRYARFYPAGDDRNPDAKKKKERAEQTRRTLEELMRDPEYARLYNEVGDRLRDAETEADTAIAMIQSKLAEAEEQIEIMEDNAARGPDGQFVFRYADGRVVYADGTKVPDDIAAGIVWPDNAPSAEEYFAALNRQQQLEVLLSEWSIYRNDVLGGIRDRYDDPDNPFQSPNALQDALDQIEALRPANASMEVVIDTETSLTAQPQAFPSFN